MVLTGGGCRIPILHRHIQKYMTDSANLNLSLNPEEAVAQGAAILGAFFDREEKRAARETSSYFAIGL